MPAPLLIALAAVSAAATAGSGIMSMIGASRARGINEVATERDVGGQYIRGQGSVLQAEGALLQGRGAILQGDAQLDMMAAAVDAAFLQADTYAFNADLLLKQVDIANLEGDVAFAKALYAENRVRETVERTISSQIASFSASHIDPTRGSPLLLAAKTAAQGEVDARLIRAGAIIEAAQAGARAANVAGAAAGAEWSRTAALMRASEALTAGAHGAEAGLLGVESSLQGFRAGMLGVEAAYWGAGTAMLTGQARDIELTSGMWRSGFDTLGNIARIGMGASGGGGGGTTVPFGATNTRGPIYPA